MFLILLILLTNIFTKNLLTVMFFGYGLGGSTGTAGSLLNLFAKLKPPKFILDAYYWAPISRSISAWFATNVFPNLVILVQNMLYFNIFLNKDGNPIDRFLILL